MTTPVLTQKQQRKSLSVKKGPVKGLKNVLAQPNDNYWPLLKNDHEAALENILKRSLSVLKRSEVKIPWSELRKMNKEERLSAKKKAKTDSNANYDDEAAKSIVNGINAVTRMLEKDDACCILLDASVDPSILVKHIVVMAKNKNIPVLLIPFLKKVTMDTMGFASAAVGLKKHVEASLDNYFHILFLKVSELASVLPTPKSPVALFQNDNELDESQGADVEKMVEDIKIEKPLSIATDIYLHRSSKKERVFRPLESLVDKQAVKATWSDYISLGNDEFIVDKKMPSRFFETSSSVSDMNRKKIIKMNYSETNVKTDASDEMKVQLDKNQVSYKPLKVKRLQGNVSRTKATKPPKLKKK